MRAVSRRRLLASAATLTAAGAAGYWWHQHRAVPNLRGAWGDLRPVADETTGAALLRLPEGFRYASFGWTGEPMWGGVPTPPAHDGMGVVRRTGDIVTLIRNHEIDQGPLIGEHPYDDARGGGTTTLEFDVKSGAWLSSWASLAGTSRNCAGGPTPWGTWISCEETLEDAAGSLSASDHGWAFEVTPGGGPPKRLEGLGRFRHEAAAVDPASGIVYLTEDHDPGGFYRFLPEAPGNLGAGGRLQMLGIDGARRADLRSLAEPGEALPAAWFDIDDPGRAHHEPRDGSGVVQQGLARGAAIFRRLEGCWFEPPFVYFTSTSGGPADAGQIWEYQPGNDRLRLVYASTARSHLDRPDNLVARHRDFLLLCEDGRQPASRLMALTPDGLVQPLAQNDMNISGVRGISGNFRRSEWAGAAFAGDWLFVNIQRPGVTFAITGPWERISGKG